MNINRVSSNSNYSNNLNNIFFKGYSEGIST